MGSRANLAVRTEETADGMYGDPLDKLPEQTCTVLPSWRGSWVASEFAAACRHAPSSTDTEAHFWTLRHTKNTNALGERKIMLPLKEARIILRYYLACLPRVEFEAHAK